MLTDVVAVDWELAERLGVRLHPAGPRAEGEEARAIVGELRDLAAQARQPVRELTGLVADPDHAPAVVVDRGQWVRSNVSGFRIALDPLLSSQRPGNATVDALGSRLTAVQLAAALAWLSGKVLGQYEAFAAPGEQGRLLLVAPNIVHVERQLELVPHDFRLWVCLHEETHRAQFGGVPWLPGHFLGEVHALMSASDIPVGELVRRLGAAAGAVVGAARGDSRASLLEAMQTPAQREIFDRLTGLMSLLEGHADYVMDEVGPAYVPTVETIRARFDVRRSQAGTVDGFARRLLGMETKMRQYTQGSQFVRTIIERAGQAGFAQVWAAPANLPHGREIEDPDAWVRRVLG
jgi:coenzyme F420 biosynthesis associated uncharacterized protein